MALQTTTRLTYDDYVKLPDDGKRYEIIDGELFVNPAPIPRHQRIIGNLYFALRTWFAAQGGGEVFVSPIDVVLGEHDIVEPDIVVIRTERASIVGEKNIQGAPNLVVEVLSDGSRRVDEITKRKLYERNGVDEYWVVDGELELMKIYRRTAAGFERADEITTENGGTITTPLLPGFALNVGDVFSAN